MLNSSGKILNNHIFWKVLAQATATKAGTKNIPISLKRVQLFTDNTSKEREALSLCHPENDSCLRASYTMKNWQKNGVFIKIKESCQDFNSI